MDWTKFTAVCANNQLNLKSMLKDVKNIKTDLERIDKLAKDVMRITTKIEKGLLVDMTKCDYCHGHYTSNTMSDYEHSWWSSDPVLVKSFCQKCQSKLSPSWKRKEYSK